MSSNGLAERGFAVEGYHRKIVLPYYAYDYVALPLYSVLPKPSELDNVLRYLVTGEKSTVIPGEQQSAINPGAPEDLNQPRVTFNLWRSFWSNLAFVVFMMCAGCMYLARKDF